MKLTTKIIFVCLILSACNTNKNQNINDKVEMYIIVNKYEDDFFDDEILEVTRKDIDFEDYSDSLFMNEPSARDSIYNDEFSELDKKIAQFLKNSSAFIISKKEIIDSTIKILSHEKVNYELLCGYDLEAFIVKNDTILNHFQINSICGFAYLGSNRYLFDKEKFLKHLKTLDKINTDNIKFNFNDY